MDIHENISHLARPIGELVPYRANPREGDIGAIVESLQTHGQYKPIVVNIGSRATVANEILAGNHTYQAALAIGAEQIAVTYVDVDDETAAKIVLVDNRTNDLASYDESALTDLLAGLVEGGEGLGGTGYDEEDLADLLARVQGPLEFKDIHPDGLEDTYACPKCGYSWSGSPT